MAKNIYQKPIHSSQDPNPDNNTQNVSPPSIGQAIRELPGQYIKVLTRPSVNRFVEEKGKAQWGIVWIQLVFTPVSFLAAGGILYLIARVLGGTGRFLEQIYVTLLFGVPLVILSYLLLLIKATSSWLPYLPHLYSLVLFVLSLIAVHKLSKGTAIAVILIPVCVLLLLALAGTLLWAAIIQH